LEDAPKKKTVPPKWDVTEKDLRELRFLLANRFPTDWPVRWKRCAIPDGTWGDTELKIPRGKDKRPYILIRINKDMPLAMQWIIMLHEYAHARQQRGPRVEASRLEDHDGEWGVNEAQLWSEFGG
jgi:hypothetical protein